MLAQSIQQRRAEIDAKRMGVDYTSRDALPRGREFKRIDSTYYVGWMLEGCYKFDHAADYIGFKTAGTQLERAVKCLEKDFKKQLQTRTTDVFEFIKILKIHRDWDYVVYCLMNCYSNTEDVDKLWTLLQKCRKYDLQDEQYLDTYLYLAWTVHRNRFYTSAKYPFLKNTIEENEKYANRFLDSATAKIKRDANLNKAFLAIDYEANKMPGVWHYKSILYSYQLNIPSAGYYYEKLRRTPFNPHNNYATFCAIQGHFAEATAEYTIAKAEDTKDKRMKESYYYLSIMNAYRGQVKSGIQELKDLIKANGSTPGFGWYNMALSREFLYDGQVDMANRYIKNAEQFKEIHIGTTLGQSHYDFTTALLKIIIKQREIDLLKFLHKGWWYNPTLLSQIAQKTAEKYSLQFLMINQFATNPERDRVIYKLFSTESTVSFDEIWQLIEGFSTNYFLERFKKEMINDRRKEVRRYYKYFVAKLMMKKENYHEAKTYLQDILMEKGIDPIYEKLFLARIHEALIECNQEIDKKLSNQTSLDYLMLNYPQLMAFSGIRIQAKVQSNAQTANQKFIIDALQKANFNWVNTDKNTLKIQIKFYKKGGLDVLDLSSSYNASAITTNILMSYQTNNLKDITEKLPLYVLGVGNELKNINMGEGKKNKGS